MNTISKSNDNATETTCISKHANRRSLVLLIAAFIVPVVLAKLALTNQWLNRGVTNQGQLLSQAFTLTDLGLNNKAFAKQWLIIYLPPHECLQTCEQNIETVHNSYVALGKDMPRITAVLLNGNNFTTEQSNRLIKSQWFIQGASPQVKSLPETNLVFIADPLGNIILKHKAPQQLTLQSSFGKGIIADMKKLLKYSKVG